MIKNDQSIISKKETNAKTDQEITIGHDYSFEMSPLKNSLGNILIIKQSL